MTHNKPRESGYDLMRLCAMIAVVVTHVLMVYRVPGAPVSAMSLLDALLHFAVPVFFFVSGALVWGRYTGTGAARYTSFLRRRAITIAAPYLAWSALYLTIAGIRGDWVYWITNTPMLLLTGRSWTHLYFVPVLLLYYLLTPVAVPLIRRWPELAVAGSFLVRLMLVQPASEFAARLGGPMLVTFTATAFTHLSVMVLGAWFARRRSIVLPFLSRWWPAFVLLGAASLTGTALDAYAGLGVRTLPRMATALGMALIVLGLAGVAFKVRLTPAQAARTTRLSAYSFGVYLIHPALILAWRATVSASGGDSLWNSVPFALVSVSLITVASLATSSLLARSPRTGWLVGQSAGHHRPVVVEPLTPSFATSET